jgi:transposase
LVAAEPAAVDRLDEVIGIGRGAAQAIIAEVDPHMSVFATRSPGLVGEPVPVHHPVQGTFRPHQQGQPYLEGTLGEAAAAAAHADTFLGERYRRIVQRRGKLKSLVAVARTI